MIEVAANAHRKSATRDLYDMCSLWYLPFYHYVTHGDPHLGTIPFDPITALTSPALDFGCIRVFRSELAQAVISVYQALRDDDEAKTVEAYRLWGSRIFQKSCWRP